MIDADSLRVLKHVKGAHMTFATSVAFSPDEQFILSGKDAAGRLLYLAPALPGAQTDRCSAASSCAAGNAHLPPHPGRLKTTTHCAPLLFVTPFAQGPLMPRRCSHG